MLTYFREKFTGWIALAILATIGLSFVFVGLNYDFAARSFAAKVDGESISVAALENAWRERMQQIPQLAQSPQALQMQYRRSVLEELIQQQVIDNYLAKAGYRVSTGQLTKIVHAIPQFQLDGVFDAAQYEEALALEGSVCCGIRAQRAAAVAHTSIGNRPSVDRQLQHRQRTGALSISRMNSAL